MSWLSQILGWLKPGATKQSPVPQVPQQPVPQQPLPEVSNSERISSVWRLINSHRRSHGLQPLTLDAKLNSSAQDHAHWMAENKTLMHRNPLPADVHGEIIQWGVTSAEAAFENWRVSPRHNAIMLGQYSRCGIGAVGEYWCGVFW